MDSQLQFEIERYKELDKPYLPYHYPPEISTYEKYMLSIWDVIGSQWRAVDRQIVGIDIAAAEIILNVYNIKLTPDLLDMIRLIEHKYVKSHREAMEEANKRK